MAATAAKKKTARRGKPAGSGVKDNGSKKFNPIDFEKRAKPKPPTMHQVTFTEDELAMIWRMTEAAMPGSGAAVDLSAAVRSKIRALVMPVLERQQAELARAQAAAAARQQKR